MTIFFKSTRLDGTDFYSGQVDYASALASGEPLPELSGDVEFPGPGWYHLATVPTECVGMSWPCRLFEVEPADDLGGDRPRHEHKVGATAVRVLAEVDAHVALGPQGVQVAALIERCATLTADDVRRLDATRDAAWDAWDATRAARVAARDAAWGAALDATAGLMCRDLIGQYPGWDQDAYNLLTGPWRRTIGPIHPDDAPMSDYLRGRIDKQERIRNVMAGER